MSSVNHDQKVSSNNLSDDVIDLRHIFYSIRRRKRIVIFVALSVSLLSIVFTILLRIFKPVYVGSFSLLISDPMGGDVSRNSRIKSEIPLIEQLARNNTTSDIPTLVDFLQSPLLLKPILVKFDIPENELLRRININDGLSDNNSKGILKVSLRGRDVKQSSLLLDAICTTYLKASLDYRQQRLNISLKFLNDQAPSLQKRADDIQLQLARFRNKHSLLDPRKEGISLKDREDELEAQVFALEMSRDRLLRIRREVENGTLSARGFEEAVSIVNDLRNNSVQFQGLAISDVDQSLLKQLIVIESEIAGARSKYRPTSPMIKGLELRLAELKPLVYRNQLEAVDAALSLNQGRLQSAKKFKEILNKEFLKQPDLIMEYESLQSKLTLAQKNLNALVAAKENFQLEIAQRNVPWRLIDPPKMDVLPVSPSVPRNIALGTLLGIVSGIIAGLIRDRISNLYRYSSEVKRDISHPFLGVIPYYGELDYSNLDVVMTSNPVRSNGSKLNFDNDILNENCQEVISHIFASIRYHLSKDPSRILTVTSSASGEGKTSFCILLSKVLAQMRIKILLIDANTRDPQLHNYLKLDNSHGLADLIEDDELDWQKITQKVDDSDYLQVITSGTSLNKPDKFLRINQITKLIDCVVETNYFEYILIDTPSAIDSTDSSLIAQNRGNLIFMVSLNRINRFIQNQAIMRVSNTCGNVLGIVTNNSKPTISNSNNIAAYSDLDSIDQNGSQQFTGNPDEVYMSSNPINKIRFHLASAVRQFLIFLDN